MSGGYFNYRQYVINEIADDIDKLIKTSHDKVDWRRSNTAPITSRRDCTSKQ